MNRKAYKMILAIVLILSIIAVLIGFLLEVSHGYKLTGFCIMILGTMIFSFCIYEVDDL